MPIALVVFCFVTFCLLPSLGGNTININVSIETLYEDIELYWLMHGPNLGSKVAGGRNLVHKLILPAVKKPAALDTHGTRKLHESIIQSPVVGRGIWFGIFWQLKSALNWSSRPLQGSLTSSLPNPTTPWCARKASQLPQKMRLNFPATWFQCVFERQHIHVTKYYVQ